MRSSGHGDQEVLTEVGDIRVAEDFYREFLMWWEVSKAEVRL